MKNPPLAEPVRRDFLTGTVSLKSIKSAVPIQLPDSSQAESGDVTVIPVNGDETWISVAAIPNETIDPIKIFIEEIRYTIDDLSKRIENEKITPSGPEAHLQELERQLAQKQTRLDRLYSGELSIDRDIVREYAKWKTGPRYFTSPFFRFEGATFAAIGPGPLIIGNTEVSKLAVIPAFPGISYNPHELLMPFSENYYGVWKGENSKKVLSTAFSTDLNHYFSFALHVGENGTTMAEAFRIDDNSNYNYGVALIHSCFSMEMHQGALFFQIFIWDGDEFNLRLARFDGNATTVFEYELDDGRSFWKHPVLPEPMENEGVIDPLEPGFFETTNMKSFGGKLFLILNGGEDDGAMNNLFYFDTESDEDRFVEVRMRHYKTEPGSVLKDVFLCRIEVFKEGLYFVYRKRGELYYRLGVCNHPFATSPDFRPIQLPDECVLSTHQIAVTGSVLYLILKNETGTKYFLYSFDGETFTDLTSKFSSITIGSCSRVWTNSKGELLVYAKEKDDSGLPYKVYSLRDVESRSSSEFSNGILPPAAPYRPILYMGKNFAPNRTRMHRTYINNCTPGYASACHDQYEIRAGGSYGFSTRTTLKRTSDLALRSAQGPAPAPAAPVTGLEFVSASREVEGPPEMPVENKAQWVATLLYTDKLLPEATNELTSRLDKLASSLKSNSQQIILSIYADDSGNTEDNLQFCDALAAALLAFLIKSGIKKNRIVANSSVGSGAFSNKALNNRLEISLLP
ncbi:MAG: hypothetical protein DYG98_15730 [Haliscomenobacteraceae bacterium CHB4]|nr:hypothetical protein [Saprospiraceae bacterium]MCE7924496.1 hypothetical protein [Haliscomenobacteraceae bacterium CHB4]